MQKGNWKVLIPGAYWILATIFVGGFWIVGNGITAVLCLLFGLRKHLAEVGLLLVVWGVIGLFCRMIDGQSIWVNLALLLGGIANITLFTKTEWQEIIQKIK